MNAMDIGIDLGTATVIIYDTNEGVLLDEPSVVAIETRTGEVKAVGADAYRMIGKTPANITAIRPLQEGVISDYKVTEAMIKYFLHKVCHNKVFKPRMAICVPTGITPVEVQAVEEAAQVAGARKVYLIEEPVAAAIGAGIDISKPEGHLVVDIGGGTTDIAVLSLNGIVCKSSLKVAGNVFDQAIVKYVRSKYGVLIGERMAERMKMEIGSADPLDPNKSAECKGRNLLTGLPCKLVLTSGEIQEALAEPVAQILQEVKKVMELTPPELVSDLYTNGAVLTGGGAMLDGLDRVLSKAIKAPAYVAEEPELCVAKGTGRSFQFLNELFDGFVDPNRTNYQEQAAQQKE